jgi:tetratricopeptide (TPR) repeat protein
MRRTVRIVAMGSGFRLAVLAGALGLMAGAPSGSRAAEPADTAKVGVGRFVVPKHQGFTLGDGGDGPRRTARPAIYHVEQVQGAALRLKPEGSGPSGWVAADQVVPVEEAVAFFTKAIEAKPRDPFLYAMRAKILLEEGDDLEQALADCDQAIRLDPKAGSVYGNRAAIWSAQREFDKAIADDTEAIRLDPKDSAAYRDRGAAWVAQQEFDKAVADLTQAIRLDPQDADAFGIRGSMWSSKREHDKAIADYSEVIRLDPKNPDAYIARGVVRIEKGEADNAITDFNTVARLVPQAPIVYQVRGTAWRSKQEYDKAIADFSEAIRLDPENPGAYFARGLTWQDKKASDKAIGDFDKVIRLDPRNAQAYFVRGAAWSYQKDYDKAIADFNRAIRFDPKHAAAYSSRGFAWSRKKDFDKAIADFDQAVQLDRENPDGHNGCAWLRATCPDAKYRDGKKAVEAATKACELTGWKEPGLLDTLAAAYAEAGDFAAAVKWQTQAIEQETDKNEKADYGTRLKLYREKRPFRDAEP